MVHDPGREDPTYAFALSRLGDDDARYTPFGVFRDVEMPTYEELMAEQVATPEEAAHADLARPVRRHELLARERQREWQRQRERERERQRERARQPVRAGQRAWCDQGVTVVGGRVPGKVSAWEDETGVVTLPSGVRVRGRRLTVPPAGPADFALLLAAGPIPAWRYRRVRWPDFWIPTDRADALDALREAHRRAHDGERVEVACKGGIGRTGTALAALAILDGLAAPAALTWVRAGYHERAVETPWQRRWLRTVR